MIWDLFGTEIKRPLSNVILMLISLSSFILLVTQCGSLYGLVT